MNDNNNKNDFLLGCICAIACEVVYGMSFMFTKKATSTASPFAMLGWRFFVAFLTMSLLAVFRLIKIDLKGKCIRPLIKVAIFFPVIYYIGETLGIDRTTASESGVFIASIPVVTLTASAVFLKKNPSRLQVAGVLITLVGVLLTVFAVGSSSSFSISGYAFLLTAVISYALYCVLVSRASDYTSTEITYIMLVMAAAVFVALAFAEAAATGTVGEFLRLPFTNRAVLNAVLYNGIGSSVLGFFLANVAIKKIGVNRNASFVSISTLVSILSGVIFLHEPFTAMQAAGAAIIIVGVYIANAKRPDRTATG